MSITISRSAGASLLARLAGLPLFALCCTLPDQTLAQSAPAVSTIFAFAGSQAHSGPIVGPDGALYGTSVASTSTTGGLVYRATADGTSIRTLYQLRLEDGYTPQAGLILGSDGAFYGATRLGHLAETNTSGTIYRLAPDGTGFRTLHRFANYSATNQNSNPVNTDGAFPESELVEGSDGYLYGMTRAGGSNGTGVVFKLTRDGSDFRVLHEFGAVTSAAETGIVVNADGAAPVGALVAAADGYFYGVTSTGGADGRGTVFRLRFDGTAFESLHAFSATTSSGTNLPTNVGGATPLVGLLDGQDGFLYGAAGQGGASGSGTLFAIAPDGAVFTVLHDFDGTNGTQPSGALALGRDGRLYGTTFSGGTGSGGSSTNLGTIFSIGRDGTGFTRLYVFDQNQGGNPVGRMLQLTDTVFVGVTQSGARCGQGTLYRMSFAGDTVEGNTRCGQRKNSGGGAMAPGLLLIVGLLGLARRRIQR